MLRGVFGRTFLYLNNQDCFFFSQLSIVNKFFMRLEVGTIQQDKTCEEFSDAFSECFLSYSHFDLQSLQEQSIGFCFIQERGISGGKYAPKKVFSL